MGALLFLISTPIHLFLSQETSIAVSAITLSLIGGAYIGFGARSENLNAMALELFVAFLFGVTALAGLLWHWSAIPVGLVAHAIWDLMHHNSSFGAKVPKWYIPLCVVYDLAAALFLAVIYVI